MSQKMSQKSKKVLMEKKPDPGMVARFENLWKIKPEEFAAISTTKITKKIITPHENIVLRWSIELSPGTEPNKMNFGIVYENGPPSKVEVSYKLAVKKPDQTFKTLIPAPEKEKINLGSSIGMENFDENNDESFRKKYDLCKIGFLIFQVTLEIPTTLFTWPHKIKFPPREDNGKEWNESEPLWLQRQFDVINDLDKVLYSDIKLVAQDYKEFYCHRMILAAQSDTFGAWFRNMNPTEERNKSLYFATFDSEVLRYALKYVYTGNADLKEISSITVAIKIFDFAEQYKLMPLKETCTVYLWDNISKSPEECADIVRLADLHDDTNMKFLKDRAFDILVENYDQLSESGGIFIGSRKRKLGEDEPMDQESRLQAEFMAYMSQRKEPNFG